jgi:hypothetical protein
MTTFDRRRFVQLSAGALLAAYSSDLQAESRAAHISAKGDELRVSAANYSWEYSSKDDRFRMLDSKNRLMTSGTVQPAVVVAPAGNANGRKCQLGKLAHHQAANGRATFIYEGINDGARLSVTWRFDDDGIWIEPFAYETQVAEDVVSVHYFAEPKDADRTPTLQSSFFIIPGISEASAISPIEARGVDLNETVWLGRGSPVPGLLQQWGLPVHYFCGFNIDGFNEHGRDLYVDRQSNAFACGLGDLPNGDLFLDLRRGHCSPWVDYRSDLWKHLHGPGKLTLGATWYWAVGSNYYDAIGNYYRGLVSAGTVEKKQNSPKKTAVALTPQFCTWGAQVARDKTGDRLDEAFLTGLYDEMKAAGMKARMFSIDDKWEGRYGNLEHSTERLPHFEQFLDRVRADGNRIGLWAALMRSEQPSEIGLTEDHMLKKADGTPVVSGGRTKYFILDFTQPEVAKILSDLARKFVRRYKPDLVKFDFGYELPAVAHAAPKDKQWAGERMMWKGLDVVITAMREENPNLVVMYYQLSPLFLKYFDLHSPDDLFLNAGEYDVEANRRFFFSSLMGELGVPTYGSSGYDWESAPNIWFDSTVIGTLGSLNDFAGDERGEKATPELIARYNGLTQTLRSSNFFKVIPLDGVTNGATRGAHSGSWARIEDGKPVLLAIRPRDPGEIETGRSDAETAQLRAMIGTSIPVVVASQTEDDISRASRLAIAPYGVGDISIRRARGSNADIIVHRFGGSATKSRTSINQGWLRISVKLKNGENRPIEWIEVHIS